MSQGPKPLARTHYLEREKLPVARRIAATFGAVAMLHVAAACLLAYSVFADEHPLALGLLATAYLAGVKHSYDWDHIAAIDNSSRRFAGQGRAPVSVGFAFSMGHSTVVLLAGVLVVGGASVIASALEQGSAANTVLGIVGAGVSALFLLTIGIYNGTAFRRAAQLSRHVRRGGTVTAEELRPQGLVARLLDRPLSRVRRPRDIYVLGFLFGLGFDTATTIAFLLLAVSAALAGISPLALMALPLGFAAGMTLCDTANGLAMMRMYRSAVSDPQRRIGFNMVVTGLSAVSALFVAVLTIGAVLHGVFGLEDPVTTWLGGIDLGHAGLLLVGLFLAVWAVAALLGARRRPAVASA
jgi:high-affinity nickel-transport protein